MLLAYSSYSCSEVVFSQSANASAFAHQWTMLNILPQQAGLTVSNVVYKYRVEKLAADPMVVAVQNENANGSGYIFRSVDDWSGVPGNNISKVVPVGAIPIEAWGDGSIEVTGIGTVEDPSVIYTYRYDTCFIPTTPDCPGYEPPLSTLPVFVYEDPLEDEMIQQALELQELQEEEERIIQEEEEEKETLEKKLGLANTTLLAADSLALYDAMFDMSGIPATYYTSIPGGVYTEVLEYNSGRMPDNKNARRVGLATQLKHEEMVNSQYDK